jgi:predicted acylesterase/phospholipase RssA
MSQLRISLTLSGAVSLGAYEGGALAALLYAVREIAAGDDPPLRIDVISGASAGSITALLAARALLQGHDPCAVLSGAWVQGDSLGDLLGHGTKAPLSIEKMRELGTTLLDPAHDQGSPHRQTTAIQLSYTLACLRGFEYQLPRLGREPIQACAFIDFYNHLLTPDAPVASLTAPEGDCPLDAVLASGANEMGFPPHLLNRAAQWPVYQQQGIDNLPPGSDHAFWFTDGGTLDNEPLGRTFGLTNGIDADDTSSQRLHLLIHPHPTAAVHDQSWADPQVQPTFAQTAVRGLTLQRTQSLYADLKQAEKTNSHIAWIDLLGAKLGAALDQLPADGQREVIGALTEALTAMADQAQDLRAQHSGPPRDNTQAADQGPAAPASAGELLSRALHTASGLAGKQPARIDVISPLLLPESRTHNIDQILSGEILFHFGGFLDEPMRQNDFDLGYRSTLMWLDGGLHDAGLPADLASRALDAAKGAYEPGQGWERTGQTTAGSLLAMHPWQAARLTGRITHVLLHDLLHHPRP